MLLAKALDLRSLEAGSKLSREPVELDQTRVGRLSRVDALQGQAMAQEQHRRRQIELARIEAALQRIDQGEFGWCLECSHPISVGRLQADPAAPLCVDCASGS